MVLQGLSGKGSDYDSGKSKEELCSHTSDSPLIGVGDVEIVSQRPSVAMASLKRVSNSAVKRHCGLPKKPKKNQCLPEIKSCLVLESKKCSKIPVRGPKTLLQSTNNLSPQNKTTTHHLKLSWFPEVPLAL